MALALQRQGRRLLAFLLAMVMVSTWMLVGGMRIAWGEEQALEVQEQEPTLELTIANTSFKDFDFDGNEKVAQVYLTVGGGQPVLLTAGQDYTVAAGGVTTAINAGEYELTITGIDKYRGTVSGTWRIIGMTNYVQVSIENWSYGEDPKQPKWSTTSGTPPTITYSKTSDPDGEYASTPQTAVGNYWIKAYVAPGDSYESATAISPFSIIGKQPVITKAPTANSLVYNKAAQALITGGSAEGGTMQYSLSKDSGYSTTIPTVTHAGSHVVWYKVVGNSAQHYSDTEPKSVTAYISPKEVSLTWSDESFTYDGQSHAPKVTVSGLLSGDSCNVSVSNAQTNAGTYKAQASGLSNSDYTLPSMSTKSFTIAPIEAQLAWSNTSFKYDGKAHVPTATVANLVRVDGKTDTCTVTVAGAQTKVGTHKATAASLSNKNYKLPSEATCDFTITGDGPTTGNPVSRFYNPNTGEHFYTVSAAEASGLKAAGWKLESDNAWLAAPNSSSGIPVYRLYNPNNGGDHHFTTQSAERNGLKAAGWIDEGVAFYAPTSGVSIYREYNPNVVARNHNFTASVTEHQTLVRYGWKDEGVAWYGMAS